jgi:DNA-binding transcriptional LysR family regulator
MRLIDPELLRTFLAFVDGGSLARAAAIVGRSPSAVTAQMQRLEETVGEPLLAVAGRGRALTPAGEDLVIHARRILDAQRDAWLSLRGARADGRFTLGATQDFADAVLPDLLRAFARSHPRVRLELRVGRSVELARAYDDGAVDVLIALRAAPAADDLALLREPMIWLGARQGLAFDGDEIALALLDPPCGFRSAALGALEAAGRRHRIVATSGSLAGLRAAVRSGIAVTLRTARWMGEDLADVTDAMGLPPGPAADFVIRLRRAAEPVARDFAELLCDALGAARKA